MAAGPIKLRCGGCNQLLGVARSKAGSIVACPKCAIELLVPFDDDPAPPSAPRDAEPAPPSANLGINLGETFAAPVSGIPLDFLNISPEDIRVEPGVRELHPYPSAASRKIEVEPERKLPEGPAEPSGDEFELETGPPPAPGVAVEKPVPKPNPTTVNVEEPAGPPIRLDAPVSAPRPSRSVILKPRDLVIPRSVVASWSILVLAAVGFAFAAGLLIGHYVWRFH